MSAKQTVGTLPPTAGTLGSTQIPPVVSESLSSDQKPLWKMKSLEFLVKIKKFPEASDQMTKTLRPPE